MSSAARKRTGLVLPGVFLIAAGLVFLIPSHSETAQWLLRLWPGFLVLAGIVSVMGFAVERKPRSPIGGTVLMVVGVILLISRLQGGLSPIQLYGRYWPVLLVIFAGVEMVRHYSHRPYEAPTKPAFRFSRLLVVGLIVGSGLIANRVARTNPSLLSAVHLPRYLTDFRDSVTGQPYAFSDPPIVLADLDPGVRITVDNSFGDVKLVGGGAALRVTLTKGVRAWSEDEARGTAANIKLVVNRTPEGINISTNRSDVEGQYTTGMEIELPSAGSISVNNRYGAVAASGTHGPLNISAANSQVSVSDNAGNVTMTLRNSDANVSRVAGDLSVTGAKRVVASQVQGGIDLSASNGSVELYDVAGRVRVDAPFTRIKAQGLSQAVEIKTRHGAVDVSRAASLSIEAPNSQVRAEDINGNLTVNSSREPIQCRQVQGEVRVTASGSPVTAEEIRGPVYVDTSNSAVNITNFYGSVGVKTSYGQVVLVAAAKPSSDIDVENNNGEIKLIVPGSSDFTFDAASPNGFIRPVGFAGFPEGSRNSLTLTAGFGGPIIKLRTSYRDITLIASGSSGSQKPSA